MGYGRLCVYRPQSAEIPHIPYFTVLENEIFKTLFNSNRELLTIN